jgi:uncharacterized protein (TIRG00374 family)
MSKESKKRPLRSLAINATLVLVAFGLLGWVIYDKRGKIHDVFSRSLDGRLFLLAFAIYMTGLLITYVRWYFLVRVIEPRFRLRDAMLLGFIGNVFNLVIPGAVGGDLIKAAYLVRMRINKTQAIASMVLDRILGMLGLFLLAGVSGAIAWPMATPPVRRLILVVWIFLTAGFLGLTVVFGQALTRRYPGLLHGHGRVALILNELRSMSETYRRRLDVVAGALVMAAMNHSLNILAFYTMSRMMFATALPSLGRHFLIVPLTLFTTAVPLPFGALGFSEGVSEQLFKLVGQPEGALAMMGFRVVMYAGALVSVCVYLVNLRQVRALTDTAEHLEEELLEGELEPEDDAEERPEDLPDSATES